jgi:hypothetical protein
MKKIAAAAVFAALASSSPAFALTGAKASVTKTSNAKLDSKILKAYDRLVPNTVGAFETVKLGRKIGDLQTAKITSNANWGGESAAWVTYNLKSGSLALHGKK